MRQSRVQRKLRQRQVQGLQAGWVLGSDGVFGEGGESGASSGFHTNPSLLHPLPVAQPHPYCFFPLFFLSDLKCHLASNVLGRPIGPLIALRCGSATKNAAFYKVKMNKDRNCHALQVRHLLARLSRRVNLESGSVQNGKAASLHSTSPLFSDFIGLELREPNLGLGRHARPGAE